MIFVCYVLTLNKVILTHKGPYLNDVYTEGGGGVNEMQT